MAGPDPLAAASGNASRTMRDEAVGRFTAGLEDPAEILTGTRDVKRRDPWALLSLPVHERDPAAVAGPGDALVAAADGLIWGALTAAGEKLRRTPACPRSARAGARDIESARLHTLFAVDAGKVEQWRLLEGAWARVPEIATRYGIDPDCLTASLDGYARELIAAGVEHEYGHVRTVLVPCMGLAA